MEKSTNSTGGAAQQAEQARNAREGKAPNASGGAASTDAELHVPSVSDPEATDLPTSNTPHPESDPPDSPNSVAEKNKTTTPKE
ncbi:hypothetical protein H6F42_10950 [Pseudanabaena sp. FACHB-1998]|uniref:hypothetical protein n=1 Tax=Pseudanabaena sp. FACHB-1998 TaxID=2692858 RepID=UPI001681BE23|nr:hypothetical protein [Pseudanabaena sp. FACHB-1998]MBD2177430.1 hypothetical protein [Pseudanabaena sp. FACHB-1998]